MDPSLAGRLPSLTVGAGPGSPEWPARLKEELRALIAYVKLCKEQDCEWFRLESDPRGLEWRGHCWFVHEMVRHEFRLEFRIPEAYPLSPIELSLPELDGLTPKMYRGGRICQDVHFAPYWARNTPALGVAHALCMSLGPWLAAEVPELVARKVLAE